MGDLENASRIKRRNIAIQKVVLQTVATAGILSVAVLAPNMLKVLSRLGLAPKSRFREVVNRSRKRLVDDGSLSYKDGYLQLTTKGETKLRQLELQDYKLKKPRRWDQKWRVLIFDISERRRELRDKVRRTLVSIGFVRLQDSVWVYPYDCEDLVILLKADFKIGKDLLYMIVDSIENDRHLKDSFELS